MLFFVGGANNNGNYTHTSANAHMPPKLHARNDMLASAGGQDAIRKIRLRYHLMWTSIYGLSRLCPHHSKSANVDYGDFSPLNVLSTTGDKDVDSPFATQENNEEDSGAAQTDKYEQNAACCPKVHCGKRGSVVPGHWSL